MGGLSLPIPREYKIQEKSSKVQLSWQAKSHLTLGLAGGIAKARQDGGSGNTIFSKA